MITENLSTLKIHKLTQAQYDRELEAGNIDASALYLTPEEEIDLSLYATKAEVEQLKTSVSEGKALIASAVTDMGVQTADDATFATISSNIKSISSDTTAVASDIASGKTAYVNGSKVTGNVYTVSTSSSQDADSVLFHDSSTYDDGSYDITFKKTFTSDTLYRAGSVCKLTQASSNLGDATAADVAAGKTFTSSAGLKVTGTSTGVLRGVMDTSYLVLSNISGDGSGTRLAVQFPSDIDVDKVVGMGFRVKFDSSGTFFTAFWDKEEGDYYYYRSDKSDYSQTSGSVKSTYNRIIMGTYDWDDHWDGTASDIYRIDGYYYYTK